MNYDRLMITNNQFVYIRYLAICNILTDMLTITTSRTFTISEGKDKDKKNDKKSLDMHQQVVFKASNGIELSKDQLTQMSIFQKKQVGKHYFCTHTS